MLGGTMVVQFAIDAIDANGRYDIVMAEAGKRFCERKWTSEGCDEARAKAHRRPTRPS